MFVSVDSAVSMQGPPHFAKELSTCFHAGEVEPDRASTFGHYRLGFTGTPQGIAFQHEKEGWERESEK